MRLLLRFLGRCLFAFLFISSGLSKLQGFYDNSSKLVSMLQPRITQAIEKTMMTLHLDLDKPEVTPAIATYALYAILFLELVGGVSFMFFPRAGSGLLSLYLVLVTPVMHDFYNHRPGSRRTRRDGPLSEECGCWGRRFRPGSVRPADEEIKSQ